eukprot:6917637-Karenia_brevis.AAC.1
MSWILVVLDYIGFSGNALTKENVDWRDGNILKLATSFKHATGILSLNDSDLIFEQSTNRRVYGALPVLRAEVSIKGAFQLRNHFLSVNSCMPWP